MSLIKKKTLPLFMLLIAIFFLVGAATAEAAIKGFIAVDQDGNFYEYSYSSLLDSYALKVLGLSNGLYESFAAKKTFALVAESGIFFDYQAVINSYAQAKIDGKPFNLLSYFSAADAGMATVPLAITVVSINNEGAIEKNLKTTAAGNSGPPAPAETPTGKQKTPLIGLALVTLEQAQTWARNRGAEQRFIDIAPLYWDYGLLSGLRPEVLYAQAAVETNFGRYDNRVPADYNNWAGIKTATATGDSAEDHERFATPEEGVRAHYNHMAAYVGFSPIGEPHGRFHIAAAQPLAGMAQYVEDLSSNWAPPADYHVYIIDLIDQMKAVPLGNPQPGTPPLPAEPALSGNADKVVVDVDVLRLRSGPSTDHQILDRLFLGTMLQVNGRENEWLKVTTPDGKNGWVHGAYVRSAVVAANSLHGRKIAVDPGHGGSDPGATGTTGSREKTVNLIIAQKLIAYLREAGATVVVTRTGDQTVNHQQRVGLINGASADLMISIHANAFSSSESNGTETHYCPRNANSAASRLLALQLQRELIGATGLRNRGVKESSFFVLNNVNIPAALVEIAFISNPAEEQILLDPAAQDRIAMALYRGIVAYYDYKR